MGFFSFIYVYLLGGITFLPLVVITILLHAHLTLPHIDPKRLAEESSDGLRDAADTDTYLKSGGAAALEEKFKGKHDSDVAEGYFAVCREYVPGGVNGKPPERTTPAGEVVREESPSIYQSMYRNLFARPQAPTLEPGKTTGRFAKKPRNVFYVVLRHGHLMLYDDEQQVEVRHVISLAHHKVDLYGGGNDIPEGELWIKRNAVRLRRKDGSDDIESNGKPFFFFSENCSAKEDFYFALLQNQDRDPNDPDAPPMVQAFDNVHMFNLIKSLHSSNEQYETRWFNALLGRIFLGVYKTQFIEDVIRMKITKKISRVKKPAFLTGIILRNINLGKSAPLITNPKLKDLNIDGNCCVEADFEYTGNVRVEIAATVRIDLGTRFKAREVHLVLAVTLKKLAGHTLLRFKPPPSNRAWITFETMPQMEMTIEPIVSTRQITYGVILRTIESRIREVFAETLVNPYWDDIPFMDTDAQRFRGGIWAEEGKRPTEDIVVPDETSEDETEADVASLLDQSSIVGQAEERSSRSPALAQPEVPNIIQRKGRHHSQERQEDEVVTAASSAVENRPDFPRALRSSSTTSAPTVSTSNPDTVSVRIDNKHSERDASSLMREISSRSPPQTPLVAPQTNKSNRNSRDLEGHLDDLSAVEGVLDGAAQKHSPPASLRSKPSFTGSVKSNTSTPESRIPKLANLAKSLTPSDAKQHQLAALAQNVPRSWSWAAMKKPKHSPNPSGTISPNSTEPYGRGRPLPPLGQPLPPPERPNTFAASAVSLLKRKSVAIPVSTSPSLVPQVPPPLPDRRPTTPDHQESASGEIKRRPVPPPPLPSRRASRAQSIPDADGQSDLVVVKIPNSISSSEDEVENEDDLDAVVQEGLPGEAAEELMEADLATPLAHGGILGKAPAEAEYRTRTGREDLTASELAARASFHPADLTPSPG